MTEKEKAAQGLIYDANYDKELVEERIRAKDILWEYNQVQPSKLKKRKKLLKGLLGKTGKEFLIEQPFYCDYGYNIEIGENFYSNHNLVILDGARVIIGDNVFVAPNVSIYTAGHPLDVERRNKGWEYARPVTIGNHVWIGGGVTILPGVTIGEGSTIGAGSVVNKDIPAGVLAAGNPCKVIKEITEEEKLRYGKK
ncbi:MAG: sugar O-acetyltransferase [Bacteroides sp.]|nr:sugar O-acetyltransferase [Bacteroides sp.]